MREKLRQNIHGVRGCEGCLEGGEWLRGGVGTGRGPRGMGGMIEQQCATAAAPRPRTRQLERQLDRTAEWLGRGPEAGRALGAPQASTKNVQRSKRQGTHTPPRGDCVEPCGRVHARRRRACAHGRHGALECARVVVLAACHCPKIANIECPGLTLSCRRHACCPADNEELHRGERDERRSACQPL